MAMSWIYTSTLPRCSLFCEFVLILTYDSQKIKLIDMRLTGVPSFYMNHMQTLESQDACLLAEC